MKRIVSLFLVLAIGLCSALYAAVPVPTDKQNQQIRDPRWAGASVFETGNATGTVDMLVATGKGVVFGVYVASNTGASALFNTLRDTATANHSSTVLAVVSPNNTAAQGANLLPMSMKFTNGLTATMSATPGVNEHWQILYRLQSDQN